MGGGTVPTRYTVFTSTRYGRKELSVTRYTIITSTRYGRKELSVTRYTIITCTRYGREELSRLVTLYSQVLDMGEGNCR